MTFFKASEILLARGWKLTSDGKRGYYLNDDISMAWCSSPEEVINFTENLEIRGSFYGRTKNYAEEIMEEESKKLASQGRDNEDQASKHE